MAGDGTCASPSLHHVLVVGRYEGTVQILAQAVGPEMVVATASFDLDGGGAVASAIIEAAQEDHVVVVTAAPGDPSIGLVLRQIPPTHVVAIAWHPSHERPDMPAAVTIVTAGTILHDLAEAVRAAVEFKPV